jgi:excisionase family DNA binding protein
MIQPITVPEPSTPNEVLTPRQVCELLSITRTTLWRLVRDGRLPVIRLSRRTKRFRKTDILALSKTSV